MKKKKKVLKCGKDYIWILEAKLDDGKWYPMPNWGCSENSRNSAMDMARKKLAHLKKWMLNHHDFTNRVRFRKYILCDEILEQLMLEDGFGLMAYAIGGYMKLKGWNIMVIGSPTITQGKNKLNFNLTFNFTGSRIINHQASQNQYNNH